MLLPLSSDRPLRRTPWVNYALILSNIAAWLITKHLMGDAMGRTPGLLAPRYQGGFSIESLFLRPDHPGLFQFFSYAFLHADGWHLGGNMVFLFVFGNSVEDRLGRLNYLLFYLCGAVFSGLGHVLTSSAPALGASGAVCAVGGAFMILFPRCHVRVVYMLFVVVGSFETPALGLVLLFIAQDLAQWALDWGNVAYEAHLTGYTTGALASGALLGAGLLGRERWDLLALLSHWRRRSEFRSMTSRGYHPWEHAPRGGPTPPPEAVTAGRTQAGGQADATQPELMRLRLTVSEALRRHDLPAAAAAYAQVIELDPDQAWSASQQRDLANQLMSERRHEQAARAYELLLHQHPRAPGAEEVQLVLGLLYTRYLQRLQRARELLQATRPQLVGADRELAEQLLAEVEAKGAAIGA